MTFNELFPARHGCWIVAIVLCVAMLPVTGCIAGVLLPLLVEPMVLQFRQAQVEKACLEVLTLESAIETYAIENAGQYPRSLEDVVPLLVGQREEVPRDPWGNPYELAPNVDGENRPWVRSLGSDGAPGGVGLAADIDAVEAARRRAGGAR